MMGKYRQSRWWEQRYWPEAAPLLVSVQVVRVVPTKNNLYRKNSIPFCQEESSSYIDSRKCGAPGTIGTMATNRAPSGQYRWPRVGTIPGLSGGSGHD